MPGGIADPSPRKPDFVGAFPEAGRRTCFSLRRDNDCLAYGKEQLRKIPGLVLVDGIFYQYSRTCANQFIPAPVMGGKVSNIINSTHAYIIDKRNDQTLIGLRVLPKKPTFFFEVHNNGMPAFCEVNSHGLNWYATPSIVKPETIGWMLYQIYIDKHFSQCSACRSLPWWRQVTHGINPKITTPELAWSTRLDYPNEMIVERLSQTPVQNRVPELLFRLQPPIGHVDFDGIILSETDRAILAVMEEYRGGRNNKNRNLTKGWAQALGAYVLDVSTIGADKTTYNFGEISGELTYRIGADSEHVVSRVTRYEELVAPLEQLLQRKGSSLSG
jgi:hypothetical protein